MEKPGKKVENFNMRVSPEFMATIDEWRRHQPDIPPRAEAIRRLVATGIAALSINGHCRNLLDRMAKLAKEGRLSPAEMDEFRAIDQAFMGHIAVQQADFQRNGNLPEVEGDDSAIG